MLSIQIILGKDEEFFDLLEASAIQAQQSAHTLKRLLHEPRNRPALEEFVKARRKDKEITKEISERLIKSFVTHLDREEIETLSSALYKVPKTIEKFATRYLLALDLVKDADFSHLAALLNEATELVLQMLRALHRKAHLEELKELNDQLQKLENDADRSISEITGQLYATDQAPLKVLALKDLYELLERAMDRCRDAGNAINYIVLKHS